MAAITDLSDLINLQTGGGAGAAQDRWFFKSARILGAAPPATIAGRPCSLWRYDGQPGAGAVPTTVAAPTNFLTGSLPFTNPGGVRQAWMTQAWATGLVAGTLILYDRLLHIGGLSGVSTVAQTVGGTLTRYTDGVGNFMFAEIYTAIGATGRIISASYTNTIPSSSTSVATVIGGTGFNEATRAIFLPLQAGDQGVRSVASVTINLSTATAGNFGITVGHPLAYIGIGAAGQAAWRDFVTGLPSIPQIPSGSCLALLWIPSTVTPPEITGGYSIVEK